MNDVERVAIALDRFLPPEVPRAEAARAVVDALHALPTGAELISAERVRQVISEGWTPDHDRVHAPGTLASAGVAYAMTATAQLYLAAADKDVPTDNIEPPRPTWPFDDSSWKPQDPVRNLVKAGALLAAEIDRSRP